MLEEEAQALPFLGMCIREDDDDERQCAHERQDNREPPAAPDRSRFSEPAQHQRRVIRTPKVSPTHHVPQWMEYIAQGIRPPIASA